MSLYVHVPQLYCSTYYSDKMEMHALNGSSNVGSGWGGRYVAIHGIIYSLRIYQATSDLSLTVTG